MRTVWICRATTGIGLLLSAHAAGAHGIAGNRFFVGTLTFDDPSVADEAVVPNIATLNHSVEVGSAVDNRFDWSFTRLLTPVLQMQIDSASIHRKAESILVPTVETLHWGLSLQYSTYYLTSRFTGGPPKDEPLNQLLPLVEFSFDTPRGQNTVATMNPGLAYVAVAWQLAAEVIVPLNREAGNSTGFRAQLLFFLDDLIPKLFDKPLLSDKPDRSLIAWH